MYIKQQATYKVVVPGLHHPAALQNMDHVAIRNCGEAMSNKHGRPVLGYGAQGRQDMRLGLRIKRRGGLVAHENTARRSGEFRSVDGLAFLSGNDWVQSSFLYAVEGHLGFQIRVKGNTHELLVRRTVLKGRACHIYWQHNTDRGFLSMARAMATRCFSPPDSLSPRSPTWVETASDIYERSMGGLKELFT